jgi:hypothetical protein
VTKKPPKRVAPKSSSPTGRSDPSRTGGLRSKFSNEVRLLFQALKDDVSGFLLGDTGGLLTANAQWDESKFKRDHGKFSSTGGASGTDQGHVGSDGKASDGGDPGKGGGSAEADKAAEGIIGKGKALIASLMSSLDKSTANAPVIGWVNTAVKKAGELTTQLYGFLEKRYGRATAITIFASGTVIAWGITLGSAATLGYPIAFPGMGTVSCLPALAIAETYKRIKGMTGNTFDPTKHPKGARGRFTKALIDPKYAQAYDHLSLPELIKTRDDLQRSIQQETAAQGTNLRGEVASANRKELFKQLNAVEERFEEMRRLTGNASGQPHQSAPPPGTQTARPVGLPPGKVEALGEKLVRSVMAKFAGWVKETALSLPSSETTVNRSEGEVWTGDSGRKFTMVRIDGHLHSVPYKDKTGEDGDGSGGSEEPVFSPAENQRSWDDERQKNWAGVLDETRASWGTRTDDQRAAIASYVGHGFKEINRQARGEAEPSADVQRSVDALESAQAQAPRLSTPATVYRSIVVPPAAHDQIMTKIRDAADTGQPFVMRGFVSASGNPEIASDFSRGGGLGDKPIRFEILASHGLTTPEEDWAEGECEMILPRDSSFNVHDVVDTVDHRGRPIQVVQLKQIAGGG